MNQQLTVSSPSVSESSPYAVFTVAGASGQRVKLALQSGTADLGADTGSVLQYFDGTAWQNYSADQLVAVPAGGALLVRVSVINDGAYEGAETFTLIATNTGNTPATGTATLHDDGTGEVFPDNTTGATDPDALLDDDRPLTVSSPSVSESSPYAVFTVAGASGQRVKLALQSGTADLGADTGSVLQYFDGTAWQNYSADQLVAVPAGGALLVRVSVINDGAYEGAETFTLIATNTGNTPATGTATLHDDGTGEVFPDNTTGATDPDALLDDDRPLTVSSPSVSESSPYAVFTVTGASGQQVWLALQSGTATLGADTGNALEYFNGTAWVAYTSAGARVPVGSSALLVRVSVVNDNVLEGAETLSLTATNAGGASFDGTATITDDGSVGFKFEVDNLTGVPTLGTPDDDRPIPAPPPSAPPVEPPATEPPVEPPVEPKPIVVEAFNSAIDIKLLDNPVRGSSSTVAETLTRSDGFQVAVVEGTTPRLVVFQTIADQFIERDKPVRFSLPYDAFVHTNADATVTLEATMADGTRLPEWILFDARSGTFTVNVPSNAEDEMQIKVTARDNEGREAFTLFRVSVKEKAISSGRSSMADQIRLATKRSSPWSEFARSQEVMLQAQRTQMAAQRTRA
ncbi:MAG: putative Ig domain-containing protein [Pseudomonadota bacterium]